MDVVRKSGEFLKSSVLVFLVVICLGNSGCTAGKISVAKIQKAKGTIEVRFSADSRFAAAEDGTQIAVGGAAKTGEDSTTQVVFTDRAMVFLKPESFFEVGSGPTLGRQNAGTGIYSVDKTGKDTRIETPHGVTAVLGTRFLLEVNASGTIVLVDEGKVSFTNPNGNSREINSRERLIVPAVGPLPAPEKIDPITCDQIFRPALPATPGFNQR